MPSFIYTPIDAKAHTPPYKIHKYFARRPHNVFNQLIENFTSPGEIILDPFCGGGVTIYEGVTQDRRVIGCDLNPLSTFIVRNMIKKSEDIEVLEKCFRELRCYLETLVKDYMFFELDNQRYDISWAEMALTIRCPKCGRPSPLANDLKIKNGKYRCSNKYCELNSEGEIDITSCERLEPQYIFLINAANRTRITKHFEEDDMVRFKSHIKFLKKEIIGHHINIPRDLIPMDWDRQFEDGLAKKGILYFQDFFTKRNLMILLLLKNRINSLEEKLGTEKYELVRIVFSNILKDCNIMSFTNAAWQGGSPTTWSKHAYWIPNQFCEVSIIPAFDKSVAKVLASIKYNNGINYIPVRTNSIKDLLENRANVLLYNAPIGHTDVPESSVDAIITDPPYGSNVQYLELSHFWYPWNQDLYERYPIFELEAVANRKKGFNGAKSQYDYENNLYEVFKNAYRVLKPMRYLSLTFNNKDICSWLALLFSILKSGFTFDRMYFQDGVKNYRQTAHTKAKGSPYGDFIYTFKKVDSIPVKVYTTEEDFIYDIDNIFLKDISCSDENRNEMILQMFVDAIPLIDAFAKTYLRTKGIHHLYSHFNKKYLSKLYDTDNANK